ncbi:hypothetical protein F2Q70_00021390 [Brassica cretica]|uniref:Uncharacterized protein n=2 Tax=Brassica cretica TaxID=69181 RepID=A0A8S9GQ00_BRACR|nr:hypothetical protein F2Q70_00021390 [Brassica cretica]KAF2558350.1 hypothetical protein F2Q68_00014932 [Brassica cretica]KAF3610719.1 hypothetical protein DY000_02047678 [Brassica cretica]
MLLNQIWRNPGNRRERWNLWAQDDEEQLIARNSFIFTSTVYSSIEFISSNIDRISLRLVARDKSDNFLLKSEEEFNNALRKAQG